VPHAKWQSAVQQTLHDLSAEEDSSIDNTDDSIKFHPMMLGVNLHINAHNNGDIKATLDSASLDGRLGVDLEKDPRVQSFLSQELFSYASKQMSDEGTAKKKFSLKGIIEGIKKWKPLSILGFPFSDFTYEFWAISILNYYENHGFDGSTKNQQYNDWLKEGKGDPNYGVIEYQLPAKAKVVIIGDYGTGLPDAVAMLENIMTTLKPDCILHVGDVYYSGTNHECKTEILDVFLGVYKKVGKSVPLFSLPGNHEYMSGGQGFYKYVLDVNKNKEIGLPASTLQEASYFCLRTEDQKWQFLGMDTGFNSLPTPMPTIGPRLQDSEVEWHKDKLDGFGGKTILLSHHQLFSVSAEINAKKSDGSTYLNDHLYDTFCPYFDTISAWFWGHEHSLGIFENGIHGLAKGRLVGNSGFEEFVKEDPYAVKNPDTKVRYKSSDIKVGTTSVKWLGKRHEWFNHGCAMIDFSDVEEPEVKYYEFPVWIHKNSAPANPQLMEIVGARETL
jgi:hypothetical protein